MIYIAVLNNLIVNGSARFLNKLYANDVDIGGTATFAQLATTGNATIGGTLGVTGATTQTGKLTVNNVIEQHGDGIELYYSRPHIDFHYENNTADYTSRIIESAQGVVTITPKFSTPNATITTGNITTLNTDQVNVENIDAENVDVKYNLKASHYDLQTVSQLGGVFRVAPSISIPSTVTPSTNVKTTSVTVTKSSSSATITIVDNSIVNGNSQGDIQTETPYIGGITWASGAYVMCSGTIGDVVTGTMFGKITTINTNSRTLTLNITSGYDGLVAGTYSASQISGLTVVLYKNHSNYPVGIELNSYGTSVGRTYIDVYGGTSNEPSVRIGNIGGLSYNGGTLENQWGIYTDNGYFKGAIVSQEGKIGGFDIDGNKLYSNGHSAYNTAKSGVYIGTDYISFGSGGVTYFKDDGTGKIGKWTVGVNDLYNGTIGNTTSALVSTGTASTANIGGSGASSHTWSFTAGNKFGVTNTGDLYCNSANIQGKIEATSGFIGQNATNGFTISNTAIYNPSTKSSLSSDTVDGIYLGKDGIALGKGLFKVTSTGVLNVGKASGNYLTFDGTNLDLKTDWLRFDDNIDSIIIGKDNESHISIDYHSFTMQDSEDEFFRVEDKRNNQGIATITDTSPIIEWQLSSQYKTIVTDCYPEEIISVIIQNAEDLTQTTDITGNNSIYTQDTTYLNNLRFNMSNLPYTKNIIKIEYTTTEKAISFTFGSRNSSKNVGKNSFASGSEIIASGSFSHAEGGLSEASGSYSHAEGTWTIASGQSSHAEGNTTKAAGVYSHAEGSEAEAMGQASHAEGYKTIAYGSYSHAEGDSTIALNGSHAEGNDTYAQGMSSHVEGDHTVTTNGASFAHAEGYYSKAEDFAAHAEGYDTCAASAGSHAEGRGSNVVSGADSAHAEGYNTLARGIASHAGGYGTITSLETAQTVIGKYNKATVTGSGTDADPYVYTNVGDYAFIIGNGSGNTTAARSNALTVDWNGVTSYYGDVTNQSLTVSSALPSITYATNSNASITGLHFTKKGNLGMLYFTVKSTGAITSGSNIFTATLAEKYRPAQYVTGCGYYGGQSIIGRITAEGQVIIRNASPTSVTLTNSVEVAFTYILKDYFV